MWCIYSFLYRLWSFNALFISHLQQIISTYCPTFNARCSKDSVYSPPRPVKILHIALCIIKHSMILHLGYGKIIRRIIAWWSLQICLLPETKLTSILKEVLWFSNRRKQVILVVLYTGNHKNSITLKVIERSLKANKRI